MRAISFSIFFLLYAASLTAQNLTNYELTVSQEYLEDAVSYLADDRMKGRATGTPEKFLAEDYIRCQFKEIGLKPWNWSYTQSFRIHDTTAVRNIIGYLPAVRPSDRYIVVSAHYDHLGRLKGKTYNGADDNASGVASLLSIARMFAKMKSEGKGPRCNIIFVAFDGKECDMAGSRHFVKTLTIPKRSIFCDVNLDMLGTDLVPPGRNREYLMLLGEERLPEDCRGYATYLGNRKQYKMDIDENFYGSQEFSKFFYGMSDQKSFADAGIPAVTFSSAFHTHTYKPTDDTSIIDFPLLLKRTRLIFNYIRRLCE